MVQDADGTGKPDGKPAQPHGEHKQQQQTQPEGGCAGQHITDALEHLVWQSISIHPHAAAQSKPDDTGKQPGAEHQGKGIEKPLPNDLPNRTAIEQRCAHVPVKQGAQPVQIAFHRRVIDPPVVLNLLPLLCGHAAHPQDILPHRVHRRCADQGVGQYTDHNQQGQHPDTIAQKRIKQSAASSFQGLSSSRTSRHTTPFRTRYAASYLCLKSL